MTSNLDLETVRYYDQRLEALRRLLDYVAEAPKMWDRLHEGERHGWLKYFSMLLDYQGSFNHALRAGKLTKRQRREWRSLERLSQYAEGAIRFLYERDKELCRREVLARRGRGGESSD